MNAFHSRARAAAWPVVRRFAPPTMGAIDAGAFARRSIFPALSTMLSFMLLVLSAHASPPGWSDQFRLSEGTLDDANHAVLTSDHLNRVHVLWDDYRNMDLELYYRQWTGSVWGPESSLTGG
ncbi:MAG: hypothetical protein KBD56_06785 [Candidatus Eisenbacteria bacterium]|nr:hypothetical protein [Candidatus Eisenbacteria bacterium]